MREKTGIIYSLSKSAAMVASAMSSEVIFLTLQHLQLIFQQAHSHFT